jgi:ribosomal protein L40E
MRMIHCPRCGTENDASEELCAVCELDLSTVTALICPICQFENQVDAQSCRQCGTHLVRISSTAESEGKRDSRGSAAKSNRATSQDVGDESNNNKGSITEGEDGDEELHDWLSELTASKLVPGEGDEEPHPGTAPLWFKNSEQNLDQTSELTEETLPDWLKNLNVTESPKIEEPPVKKPRLPGWLKESGELDESRLPPTILPDPQAEKSVVAEEEPEKGEPTPAKPDSWLIELAAMGTAELVEKELDDETRFVWDDSALVSDVTADLGEEAPDWLAEVSEIEDTPDKFTDKVVTDWLEKQAETTEQPEETKPTGTRPQGPTKELTGVPEQLVSPDLPEWLGDQTGELQEPEKTEKQDSQIEIERDEQNEGDAGFIDEQLDEAFDGFPDIQDEAPSDALEDISEFPEETQEELAILDEYLGVEPLDEQEPPPDYTEGGGKEELAFLLNYLEDEPSDSDELFEPQIDDTLEMIIKDLPELMRKPDPSDLPVISDAAKETEISTEPGIRETEETPVRDDGEQPGERFVEESTSDLPSDVESIPPISTPGDSDMPEGDAEISREEVPGWLGLLTGKLLDTFDNDFVSEWFSRDEGQEEIAEDVPLEQEREAVPEQEPEQPREIDPFFGEVIPEWVADEEQKPSDEVYVRDEEPSSPDLASDSKPSSEEIDALPGEMASEELPEVDVIDGADEWLELLDSPEDETDLSQFLEVKTLLEQEAKAAEISDSSKPVKPGPASLLFDDDEPVADLVDELPVGPLIPIAFPAVEVQDYTITKEQKQQVALLQHLTSAEPKESRPITGEVRTGTNPTFRLVVGIALLSLIAFGWLIPTYSDFLPDPYLAPITDAESGLNEAINNSAGEPILAAFEYTPATAGEMDIVAKTLMQQFAEKGSQVIAVSQMAAGTVMADRVLSEIDGLESYNMGYLPGGPIGLRNLSLCINGEGSCESTFGQLQEGEGIDDLAGVGLILVLAADRDGLINWIEQVGTQVDIDTTAGIIQPLEPVVLPYLNSGQVAGAVVGAPSAAAYSNEYLNVDIEGFQFSSLVLAQWFIISILILGAIYFGVSGFWSPSSSGADAQ